MDSKECLAINIKYYRKKYNLSQEDFAEKIDSNLTYINQVENLKRKPTIEWLDKVASKMNNNIDKNLNITAADLIRYNPQHKTEYKRIDERK